MEDLGKLLPASYFADDALLVAKKLLGKTLKKGTVSGMIVETEAYITDSASHAFRATKRSKLMRETYGHWYVHFTYGMHWCANITTNKNGAGAVLIRAVEPLTGIAHMKKRRGKECLRDLCSGPSKLCQAFCIDGKDNATEIGETCSVYDAPNISKENIVATGRIGIRTATTLPWRFYIKGNPFISR